jgi:hypothetical protein
MLLLNKISYIFVNILYNAKTMIWFGLIYCPSGGLTVWEDKHET